MFPSIGDFLNRRDKNGIFVKNFPALLPYLEAKINNFKILEKSSICDYTNDDFNKNLIIEFIVELNPLNPLNTLDSSKTSSNINYLMMKSKTYKINIEENLRFTSKLSIETLSGDERIQKILFENITQKDFDIIMNVERNRRIVDIVTKFDSFKNIEIKKILNYFDNYVREDNLEKIKILCTKIKNYSKLTTYFLHSISHEFYDLIDFFLELIPESELQDSFLMCCSMGKYKILAKFLNKKIYCPNGLVYVSETKCCNLLIPYGNFDIESCGQTPLLHAILCRNKEVFDILLEYSDINHINSFGITPLYCSLGKLEEYFFNRLISKPNILINIGNYYNTLLGSVRLSKVNYFNFLIKIPELAINFGDDKFSNPVLMAFYYNKLEMFKALTIHKNFDRKYSPYKILRKRDDCYKI